VSWLEAAAWQNFWWSLQGYQAFDFRVFKYSCIRFHQITNLVGLSLWASVLLVYVLPVNIWVTWVSQKGPQKTFLSCCTSDIGHAPGLGEAQNYHLRMELKNLIGFASLAVKWAGRRRRIVNHRHHGSSANTSTTNASIKNGTNWGDSLRCSILSANGIKKVNWFCIAGCEMNVMGWSGAPLWLHSKPPSR